MHTEIMREGPPGKTTRVSSPSLLFPTVERDSIQGEKGGEREAFLKQGKKKGEFAQTRPECNSCPHEITIHPKTVGVGG